MFESRIYEPGRVEEGGGSGRKQTKTDRVRNRHITNSQKDRERDPERERDRQTDREGKAQRQRRMEERKIANKTDSKEGSQTDRSNSTQA